MFRRCKVRHGPVWFGSQGLVRQGMAWFVEMWRGIVRLSRRGEKCFGSVRSGRVWFVRHGMVRQGEVWFGLVRYGSHGADKAKEDFKMAAYKYAFKTASQIKADAQKTGELCKQLESTVGLTAKNLLDASRDKNSLLHNEFEWNDAIAAEKHRENQARHIINCLVVVSEEEPDAEPVRVFCKIENNGDSMYRSVATVIQHPDLYSQLLESAYRDMQVFKRKYEQLRDDAKLSAIFDSIDAILKENIA